MRWLTGTASDAVSETVSVSVSDSETDSVSETDSDTDTVSVLTISVRSNCAERARLSARYGPLRIPSQSRSPRRILAIWTGLRSPRYTMSDGPTTQKRHDLSAISWR